MKEKKNIAEPRTYVSTKEYTGKRTTPIRPGADVHDKIPSRVGETLYFRDGSKKAVA